MYEGWIQFAGDEVINVARTYAYIDAGYIPGGVNVEHCVECGTLDDVLNDGKPYTSPVVDKPSWYEENNPDTWDFAGVLPLDITGLSGSTRTADAVEYGGDGGTAGQVRYGTRTVAVSAVLVGRTGASVEVGLAWLSNILAGSGCDTAPLSLCQGDELCVLSACPQTLDEREIEGSIETDPMPVVGHDYDVRNGTLTTLGQVTPFTGQTAMVIGETLPCWSTATFRWRPSTVRGATQAVAGIRNPVTGETIPADPTGLWVSVVGNTTQVDSTYAATSEWDSWQPVLWVQGLPLVINPLLVHPQVTTADDCLDDLTRSYLGVTTIAGPTVTSKVALECEFFYQVEWTWLVGNPFIYGPEQVVVTGMDTDTLTADAVGPGVTPLFNIGLVSSSATDCTPVHADIATTCMADPCCTSYVRPPSLPTIPDPCYQPQQAYRRFAVEIPDDYSSGTTASVFVIKFSNDENAKKGVRIRIYPDPIGFGLEGVDECSFCEEFNLTWMPSNSEMTIDGVGRRITTRCQGGKPIVANASVRGPGGGAFSFPTLQCGIGYVFQIDVPWIYAATCEPSMYQGEPQGDLSFDIEIRSMAL